MCLVWFALGCYGFYVIFIADTHRPMPAAPVMQQPIIIQIVPTSNDKACTLETDQSDRRDVASISLDDWNILKRDVDAAIAETKASSEG